MGYMTVYGDLIIIYPKPYSTYFRGTIRTVKTYGDLKHLNSLGADKYEFAKSPSTYQNRWISLNPEA